MALCTFLTGGLISSSDKAGAELQHPVAHRELAIPGCFLPVRYTPLFSSGVFAGALDSYNGPPKNPFRCVCV